MTKQEKWLFRCAGDKIEVTTRTGALGRLVIQQEEANQISLTFISSCTMEHQWYHNQLVPVSTQEPTESQASAPILPR